MTTPPTPDPAATYEACLETIEAAVPDRETLQSSLDAVRGRRFATLSETTAYRVLVWTRFASGFPWPEFQRYRDAIADAFPDPETVAGYGDDDIKRLLQRPGVPASESKARAAVSYATAIRSLQSARTGFVERLHTADGYDDALGVITALDGAGETTAHRFLVAVGYVPALARDDGVARLLDWIGFEPTPEAREQVVRSMAATASTVPAVVGRVLRIHAGSDEQFAGPTLAGRDPVLDGICISPPACSRCSVPDCASRRAPYHSTGRD